MENPFKVFSYITKSPFFAIINNDKYNSFPAKSKELIESIKGIIMADCKIKNPNNPAQLKTAKLIYFK